MPPGTLQTALFAAILVAFILFYLFFGRTLTIHMQAKVSGVPISLASLIAMRFRKVDERTIVYSCIRAKKARIEVSPAALETHYLAGGRVPNVISAMIASQAGGFPITWEDAATHDLAGDDVLAAVAAMANAKARGQPLTFDAACAAARLAAEPHHPRPSEPRP